jgi:hypothetical protein
MRIIIDVTRNPEVKIEEGWTEAEIAEALLDRFYRTSIPDLEGYYPEFTFHALTEGS